MLIRNRNMEMRLEAARRRTRGRRLFRLGLIAVGLFLILSFLAPGRAGAADSSPIEAGALSRTIDETWRTP
jgi:hypothetical protein